MPINFSAFFSGLFALSLTLSPSTEVDYFMKVQLLLFFLFLSPTINVYTQKYEIEEKLSI